MIRDLKARQERIARMIRAGHCTVSCAGAVHTNGVCRCLCRGQNHGALWIDSVIVTYDKGAA